MVGRVFQDGRRVDNLKGAEPAYHFEYLAVHDQRLALIRNYTNWYIIGLAISMAVFWVFMWVALTSVNLPLLMFGGVVASFFVWMSHSVSVSIDQGVVALYPRIIFLEILLDYHFYRDYLKGRPGGETERRFIEKCEAIQSATTDELWTQIRAAFDPKDFPRSRRMFRHYRLMALGSLAIYWLTVAMIIYNTFQEVGQ
jgi:hypothetical protein